MEISRVEISWAEADETVLALSGTGWYLRRSGSTVRWQDTRQHGSWSCTEPMRSTEPMRIYSKSERTGPAWR